MYFVQWGYQNTYTIVIIATLFIVSQYKDSLKVNLLKNGQIDFYLYNGGRKNK